MTIADRIRNRRLELGLSVDDLASLLQKNRATVYRYESNYIKTYSSDVMDALAKALQTTPAYFYGYDDPEEPPAVPQTPEARILAHNIDRMPEDDRKKAMALLSVAFSDFFKEEPK
ncbi:MAG: helix-turn-helix transcriptional regulator [Clostridia bacterium]|nr:helix-turn-helix transcriptional regulator [Clostridia bacterium]